MVETVERKQFGSPVQFLLSCIGYAVGLGNIWRFPMLAFQNGGGAFLFPYLCCSFIIGLPILYLELSLGQFSRAGPAVVYRRLWPCFHGIGWGMILMSLVVGIYYNVIVAWILIFLFSIITGQSWRWARCHNTWNNDLCVSSVEDQLCKDAGQDFYFNHSCHYANESMVRNLLANGQPATEQYFEQYVLEISDSMDDLGGINWKIVIALGLAWLLTALALSKGVKLIGKLSYVTATVPYVIIAILFVRSVTLDGAKKGLDFYLFDVDFGKAMKPEAWHRAATQVCYSLAIGFGGLLSLASYNPPTQNCFRDAITITCADGFMSIFGGTAVFSILGFMATKQNKNIDEVIKSGTGLAFVAYPEALNQMSFAPWLWSLLFFLMLFLLGMSSQFCLTEVVCSGFYDQFPQTTKKHKTKIVFAVCFLLFLGGFIMTTKAGIYFFNVFNDYSASFSLSVIILLEIILVCYIYGVRNFIKDLRTMYGKPLNKFTAIFGPTGYYFVVVWSVAAPVAITFLLVLMVKQQATSVPLYGKKPLPDWSLAFGWFLSILPLLALPFFCVYNIVRFRQRGISLAELFRIQPKWPSAWKFRKTDSSSNVIHPVEDAKVDRSGWSTFPVEKQTGSPNLSRNSDV